MPDRDASPRLSGALADKPRATLAQRLRLRRTPMPWSIPDEVYQVPSLAQKNPVGNLLWIGDPALVKHVLIDKAANYPKAPLELRLFSALFGQGLLGIDGDLWRTHRR